MICLSAAGLIAACIGYLPSPNSNVTVNQSCIERFSPRVQRAAAKCARDNRVTWTIKQ